MDSVTFKKRFAVWAAVAAAAMALAGCATISENTHAYVGAPPYPPVNPSQVQLLAQAPSQPVTPIGEIVLSIHGNPPRQKIEQKIKAGAASLGADGVYVVSDRTHIYPIVYWDYYGPVNDEEWNRLIVGVAYKNK